VFSVQNKKSLIQSVWKDELYKYISGIVINSGHKLIIINGMPDHLHILIGLRPVQALSKLVQDIKSSSSKWINEKRFINGRFSWQEGFGAFSYKRSDLPSVINYIRNQETHHSKTTFRKEYIKLLKEFAIDYQEKYIFDPV
jgi:REP element-mobilizing transposase RayT